MNIEKGWMLFSCDFSLQAMRGAEEGTARLVRDAEGRKSWHKMPEELRDDNGPPLYVMGNGITIEDAIINANLSASHALPIAKIEKDWSSNQERFDVVRKAFHMLCESHNEIPVMIIEQAEEALETENSRKGSKQQ